MKRLKEILINGLCVLMVRLAAAACVTILFPISTLAEGTAAGTTISNTATVSYTLVSDPTPYTATATDIFEVQEIINATLVWQDAVSVPVNSPHTDRVLTLLLTNTGNGPEAFDLTTDDALSGDQFDPAVQSLWTESNGTVGLQSDDTLYTGVSIPLTADAAVLVYVASDIPAGYTDGDRGDVQVTARSATPGAAGQPPGTTLVGAGYNGVDAVVGTTLAWGEAVASYAVATVTVDLSKSISRIIDLAGGSLPSTGARVTYRIQVDLIGSGTAEGLVISDPIPGDMTYVGGSMLLDGVPLTDSADGDAGDFGVTAPGTVTIDFNDRAAPATWSIEFDTIIN